MRKRGNLTGLRIEDKRALFDEFTTPGGRSEGVGQQQNDSTFRMK